MSINPPKPRHRLHLAIRSGLLAFFTAAFVILLLVGYHESYAHRFLPRTSIGGISVAGLTRREARDKLVAAKSYLEQQSAHFSDGASFLAAMPVTELGASLDIAGAVSQSWQSGHHSAFWDSLSEMLAGLIWPNHDPLHWQLDGGQFANAVATSLKTAQTTAQDAAVSSKNGQVIVVPAKTGKHIDVDQTKADLLKTLSSNQLEQPIVLHYSDESPGVSTDEANRVADEMKLWSSAPLQLQVGSQTYQVDSLDILKWLVVTRQDKILNLAIDQDAVNRSLDTIAEHVERPAVAREVNTLTGAVQKEGRDGSKIDRDATFAAISKALTDSYQTTSSAQVTVRAVAAGVKKITPAFTPGLYPGKYIEVDLSSQQLIAWDGDQQFLSAGVSTGKWSTPTPIGVFHVQDGKSVRAYSATFGLYMPYWMPFIGSSYGLHALPEWPSGAKEGAGHIGTPVSHGCIRLTDANAAQLYDWTDVGTVVYVHA